MEKEEGNSRDLSEELKPFAQGHVRDFYTDLYNARLFASIYKAYLRWCKPLGGWLIFNEKYWSLDRNDKIKKFAIETHTRLKKDLQEMPSDEDGRKDADLFSRHVKLTGSNGKLEAMIDCSKTYLSDLPENFDTSPNLFNCQNGTLNFEIGEFGKFCGFRAEDYITKISNVNYDPQATCPLWEQFLEEIFMGRKDIIYFIQQVIGYCLTGLTTEQCFFIFYGSGRNGKSTFLEVIEHMFGDYARHCPSATLMKKQANHIPNDVARLKGARFVNAVESGNNSSFDEALIKQLTGGDRIAARFLNKEFFEFMPNFKLFIATNHKPNIHGTDEGIWRRVKLVPFEWQVPKEKIDHNLTDKLKAELSGILNWAIAGYKNWKRDGLTIPSEVENATNEYRLEEDLIGQFINERCLLGQGFTEGTTNFRLALNQHTSLNYSSKGVKKHLSDKGIKYERIKNGPDKGKYCFVGIKLINPALMNNSVKGVKEESGSTEGWE